jgi:hypothetical protein
VPFYGNRGRVRALIRPTSPRLDPCGGFADRGSFACDLLD